MEELENSLENHKNILINCLEITKTILIYSTNNYKKILLNNDYNCKLFETHDLLNSYLQKTINNNEINYYIFIQGSNYSNLKYISDFIKIIK